MFISLICFSVVVVYILLYHMTYKKRALILMMIVYIYLSIYISLVTLFYKQAFPDGWIFRWCSIAYVCFAILFRNVVVLIIIVAIPIFSDDDSWSLVVWVHCMYCMFMCVGVCFCMWIHFIASRYYYYCFFFVLLLLLLLMLFSSLSLSLSVSISIYSLLLKVSKFSYQRLWMW